MASAVAWKAMGIENPVHLIFIAAVALVVLGPKRLPGLAKALGQGIREFRESISAGEDDAPVHGSSASAAPVSPPASVSPRAPVSPPASEQHPAD
jgi:TatA/E family protein of Tat protein translocase